MNGELSRGGHLSPASQLLQHWSPFSIPRILPFALLPLSQPLSGPLSSHGTLSRISAFSSLPHLLPHIRDLFCGGISPPSLSPSLFPFLLHHLHCQGWSPYPFAPQFSPRGELLSLPAFPDPAVAVRAACWHRGGVRLLCQARGSHRGGESQTKCWEDLILQLKHLGEF